MLAHADKYSNAFSAAKYRDLLDGKVAPNEMWKYSSFWYKDFDGMAYKTMLRQLISKWGIMSVDMQTAMTNDMGSINDDGTVDYVDNNEDVVTVPNYPPKEVTNEIHQDITDQDDAIRDFFGEGVNE